MPGVRKAVYRLLVLLFVTAVCLCMVSCGGGSDREAAVLATSYVSETTPGVSPVPPSVAAKPFAPFTPTPRPVSADADVYISETAAYLLTLPVVTDPKGVSEALSRVNTSSLQDIADWMEEKELTRYLGSGGDGGIYLYYGGNVRSIGFYAGGYDGANRSGEASAWVTLQHDDDKLFTGRWEGDYPNGDFRAYYLTTNSGNLLEFAGRCKNGVWDGPIDVTYVDPDVGSINGSFHCDGGLTGVDLRPDGKTWNEDADKRFCFLALYSGRDTYIPLYRYWEDSYFVIRLAYDHTVIQ